MLCNVYVRHMYSTQQRVTSPRRSITERVCAGVCVHALVRELHLCLDVAPIPSDIKPGYLYHPCPCIPKYKI